MSNKKITDLTELTTPTTDDVFPVVDIATNTTQKVQLGNLPTTPAVTSALASKQATLVSGTNIKTVNSTSLLGSGNVAVQDILISGTNIKTINGTSVLGSGDIVTPYTPPSGVAGAIQFSNGSAFASDAANLFWDDTNNRLGVGTNAPSVKYDQQGGGALFNMGGGGTNSFRVQRGGSTLLNVGTDNASIYLSADGGNNGNIQFTKLNGSLLMQISDIGTVATIKGVGSTSATTSLLVQNSGGNSALTILDNLNSQFGGTVISDGGFRSIAYFDSFQRVSLNNGLNTNPQNHLVSGGVGRILLVDNSEGDFNRLQFGGTTSSYPSLKRSTTNLQVRLADDSGYAPIDASLYKVGGTNGFTGTGSYTNFTIVGGIITNAS